MQTFDLGDISKELFIKEINKIRLANKNKWFVVTATVDGKNVQIKNYNTWPQIMRVDGITMPSPMEMNVSEWKNFINTHI